MDYTTELEVRFMAEKFLLILEDDYLFDLDDYERDRVKRDLKSMVRKIISRNDLKAKENYSLNYDKILKDWAKSVRIRANELKDKTNEPYFKGFMEGLTEAAAHLEFLEERKRDEYKKASIAGPNLQLAKIELERLTDDLTLVSHINPDYATGRRKNLTDDITERKALEAFQKAANILETLGENIITCPNCSNETLNNKYCSHCSHTL